MKQIIAMGGGGFSMEPENPLLDLYILAQAEKERPKICFIPTASGDSKEYIEGFYRFFEKQTCTPSHLSLFRPNVTDMEDFLLSQDILYVGGGNTRNLLTLWKEWGIDQIVHRAWEQGVILAGISAGGICWFEEGVTDSNPGGLAAICSLGMLPGSFCPHYDGEEERRPSYHHLLSTRQIKAGIACDDGAAVHFVDAKLWRAVSSRKEAKAYRVYRQQGEIVEEVLDTEFLGKRR